MHVSLLICVGLHNSKVKKNKNTWSVHSSPQFYMLLHDNQKNRISLHFHFSFINMLWFSLHLLCLSISGVLCFLAGVLNEILITLEIFEKFERFSTCLYIRINFFNLKFLWNFVTWNIHQVTINGSLYKENPCI